MTQMPMMPGDDAFGRSQPESAARRRSPWWTFVALGALVALSGLALLVWPLFAASWLLAVFVGSALAINGIALLVRASGPGGTGAGVFGGIVLIAVGLGAIALPDLTTQALVAFAGFTLIVVGAIWTMIAARIGARFLGILPGALLLIGGIVSLVWPTIALTIVALVAGVVIALIGVSIIWTTLRVRRVAKGGGQAAAETIIIIDPEQ